MEPIYSVSNPKEEKILRAPTKDVVFKDFAKKEVTALVLKMKRAMRAAKGIGLSANQIGLPYRVFVAEIPDRQGRPKFYVVFNPKIKKEGALEEKDEGCLSVPGTYGTVKRASRVELSGLDQYGKPQKIKAWGLLAHVFQHEVDHLDGKLFIDKATTLRDHAHGPDYAI